ncbi:MAG: LysR family transcriptional regulator [Pseudomonadota bacterium]
MFDLRSVDLNLLIALDVLLEEQHVSRAAQRINLTQSATSRLLGRARELFGDSLLVRSGSAMMLTERARSLQPHLRETIEQVQGLFEASAFDPSTTERRFRILGTSYVAQTFIPSVVRRLTDQAPGCSLAIESILPTRSWLHEQTHVDLAVFGTGIEVPETFRVRRVGSDNMVCVMRRGHPAARGTFTVKDYVSFDHCLLSMGGESFTTTIDRALDEHGLARRAVLKLPQVMACMEVAGCTNLFFTVASRLATKFLDLFDLTMRPLPVEFPELTYRLGWHPIHQNNPAHQWLRQACAEEIEALLERH